jgi:hypothetical protein
MPVLDTVMSVVVKKMISEVLTIDVLLRIVLSVSSLMTLMEKLSPCARIISFWSVR